MNASQVCNGVPDCPRGEDELVCGEFSRAREKRQVRKVVRTDESRDKKFIQKEADRQEYTLLISLLRILIHLTELEKRKKNIFFSSIQIRLSHRCHLVVGTPVLPALNSPAWMEPASPLQW